MFTELKAFASKEYKFQQRKSLQFARWDYGHHVAIGACVGAVMMWVREKLTTTGASWNPMQTKQFSPESGSSVHERNAMTMIEAAGNQVRYNRKGVNYVAEYLGLHDATFDIRPAVRPDRQNRPEVQIPETLVRVAEELHEGSAAVIELGVREGTEDKRRGHAIGMYRSRGGHLHFFDPSVGVYEVRDVDGFMRAWLDGCRNSRDWTFIPFRNEGDWIHCYTR